MKKTIVFLQMMLVALTVLGGPKYDATYHLISETYTLNPDGSLDYHFRKELQLFSKASFDTYGETFIWYNTEYQTLTIHEAYTVRKDGSKVQTPANAFNPSLPYACENCERFNGIREMVVTHTALEYDATIVLDYTIHTEQPFLKELLAQVNLYADVPIERYEVTFKDNYGEEKTEVPYVFNNIAPDPEEAYLPKGLLRTVGFSTLENLPEFLRRVSRQNAFYNDNKPFMEVLDGLLSNSLSDMENILAVRDYVAGNVVENDVPMRYMGYLIASPATVWNTNCGTPFEKNLLLHSMLSAAGYKSTFGVFEDNWKSNPESAVQVMVDGKRFYISASNPGDLSLEALHEDDVFVTMDQVFFNIEREPVKIQSVAHVKVVREGNGYKPQVDERVTSVQSPKAKTLLSRKVSLCNVKADNLNSNYWQLKVTNGNYGTNLHASAIARDRLNDVFVSPTDEQYSCTIEIPGYARWVTPDRVVEKKYDFGYVRVENHVVNDKMIVTRRLVIDKTPVSGKKQIRQLREMMAEWDAGQPLIFVVL